MKYNKKVKYSPANSRTDDWAIERVIERKSTDFKIEKRERKKPPRSHVDNIKLHNSNVFDGRNTTRNDTTTGHVFKQFNKTNNVTLVDLPVDVDLIVFQDGSGFLYLAEFDSGKQGCEFREKIPSDLLLSSRKIEMENLPCRWILIFVNFSIFFRSVLVKWRPWTSNSSDESFFLSAHCKKANKRNKPVRVGWQKPSGGWVGISLTKGFGIDQNILEIITIVSKTASE